jgi:phage anti-repressor protein
MDFKTFLIQNSNIKKSFLDDFFEIIREDYFELSEKFLISSNKLQIWLNISSRKDFHETITRSYVNNIDYIITKPQHKGIGKNNEKIYMLTPVCAKMILQSTKSKKGKEVRHYFIEVEKMLYKYKDLVIKKLTNELELVKNNQRPKINSSKNKIYVFKALNSELTLYKIGRAKDLKTRFNPHNSPMANDIEILFEYETDHIKQVESCIKILMKYAQYRKYKEIYQIDLNIIKKLIKYCDNNINLVKEYTNKQKGGKNLFLYIPSNEII